MQVGGSRENSALLGRGSPSQKGLLILQPGPALAPLWALALSPIPQHHSALTPNQLVLIVNLTGSPIAQESSLQADL